MLLWSDYQIPSEDSRSVINQYTASIISPCIRDGDDNDGNGGNDDDNDDADNDDDNDDDDDDDDDDLDHEDDDDDGAVKLNSETMIVNLTTKMNR
ncbi:hypothetical protein PoB_002424300 [Plakobranchus ocellatus]|uniref:Uncharacterized protein n=1 Tax=Plakobranchus ocellatus TaxID=259542 RepID=A0AAV3ZTC8_9GAST|nr:hypothetical protein PoB_002424300 [Plakobranchus ocellatus]